MQQLKEVQGKFLASQESLKSVNSQHSGKEILVPLTSSLYAAGQLSDDNKVLIDIGTGYYVEKVSASLSTFGAFHCIIISLLILIAVLLCCSNPPCAPYRTGSVVLVQLTLTIAFWSHWLTVIQCLQSLGISRAWIKLVYLPNAITLLFFLDNQWGK